MNKRKSCGYGRSSKSSPSGDGREPSGSPADTIGGLIQELRTHQIELELQNEELRRVQEALLEARDEYLDLYDFAPVGYCTLNDRNLIVGANLTLSELLGEEREALVGQLFSRFIVPGDQDIFFRYSRELIDRKAQRTCELRLLKRENDWFWARLESAFKTSREQRERFVRVALSDITVEKRLEAEIIAAEKWEVGALFAGGIAHDFNNLLTGILGNLEEGIDDLKNGRPADSALKAALSEGRKAADLTKKFLAFSLAGLPPKERTPVAALVEESVRIAEAGPQEIEFEYDLPRDLWPVKVNFDLMTQAIAALLSNAREAMPEGGVIRIRVENADSVSGRNRKGVIRQNSKFVKLSIVDQGIGIPTDSLVRVFDPYFSSKEMGAHKGQGLGLTIADSIVEKHRGFIEIKPHQPTGTTVCVYLPADI